MKNDWIAYFDNCQDNNIILLNFGGLYMEFVSAYILFGHGGGGDLYQLSAYIRTMRVRGCQIPLDPFNPCTPHIYYGNGPQ